MRTKSKLMRHEKDLLLRLLEKERDNVLRHAEIVRDDEINYTLVHADQISHVIEKLELRKKDE